MDIKIISLYRSLKAIVAQNTNCSFGVHTTIELKKFNIYFRQQWHLEGYVSTNKCVSIVTRSRIFQLSRSINFKWAICGLCLYCIQRAIYGRFAEHKHRMRCDRGILYTRLRKAKGSIVGRPFSVAEIQSQDFPNANYKLHSWANLHIRGASWK